MKTSTTLGAIAIASLAGVANANLAATFGYTDMGANWNAGSSILTISAEETQALSTSGDITNYLGGAPLTALFNSGFADGLTTADALFEMELSNITATSADAAGTFQLTDINGDNVTGTYAGTWTNQFGFGFFDGFISIAAYNALESGDGLFEGNAGQSFAVPTQSLTGGLSMLLQMPVWFDSSNGDFDARTTQLDGILVVPTPGSIALLGMGGLLAGRRRR